jgi:transcriptional regulator with XRE-family HTH domain
MTTENATLTEERTPRSLPLAEVFGQQLERVRKRKGWTQERLADEMKSIGRPIQQSAVAKVERAERAVKIEEAFAFALVLGVSPIALFVPREPMTRVKLADVDPETAANFPAWLRGLEPNDQNVWVETWSAEDNRFFMDQRHEIEDEAIRKYPVLFHLFQSMSKALTYVADDGELDAFGNDALLDQLTMIRDDLATAIQLVERDRAERNRQAHTISGARQHGTR